MEQVLFSEHIGRLFLVKDWNNHLAFFSEKDACCKFYYNYIQHENVKKFHHALTQKISNLAGMFMNIIRRLYCLNMIELLLPYILLSSWYFFVISLKVSVGDIHWNRTAFRDNISIFHKLLLKLLLMITYIHYLRCFCFIFLLLSSKIVCYSIIWYYLQIEKKSYF